MRKDKLYLLTFFSITGIVTLISLIALHFFVKTSILQVLELQIENSKREAKTISNLVSIHLNSNLSKEMVAQNLQQTIQNTNSETSFISMLDWSGKQISHPDKTKIGTLLESQESSILVAADRIDIEKLFTLIKQDASKINSSKIIYLVPVNNSDWIIASHININSINEKIHNLNQRFYLIFTIMSLLLILSSFFAVRILGSIYEKRLEVKNKELEKELISTFKLNNDLVTYQQKVKIKEEKPVKMKSQIDADKKRILTYYRDELLTIPAENIAYIYVDSTITYVVCFDGSKSTTNSSLDELHTGLSAVDFYRANRQVIIAIPAIKKIIKYGKSQLKILVQPDSEIDIIISKNRAAEFKQWLNL
jgi:DNA-binding LytR/AlgR family response regulator